MYGREELECPEFDEHFGDLDDERLTGKYYYKDEADKVMDAMEAKITGLDDAFESCKSNLESEKATNEELRERIKELESQLKVKMEYGCKELKEDKYDGISHNMP